MDDLFVISLRHSDIVQVSTPTQMRISWLYRGTPYAQGISAACNAYRTMDLGDTSLPGGQARCSSRTLLKCSEFVPWSSFLPISWKLIWALATNLSVFSSEHESSQLLPSSYVTHRACIAKSFDTMSFPPDSQESCREFTGWWKEEHLNHPQDETLLPSAPSYWSLMLCWGLWYNHFNVALETFLIC